MRGPIATAQSPCGSAEPQGQLPTGWQPHSRVLLKSAGRPGTLALHSVLETVSPSLAPLSLAGGGKSCDHNSPCFLDELSCITVWFLGRATAVTVDLGLEGSGLQGQADAWAVAWVDSSPVSPLSALCPSRRGHGPHLGLPASLLRAAAAGTAAATGCQQQQQHSGWRVERGRAQGARR